MSKSNEMGIHTICVVDKNFLLCDVTSPRGVSHEQTLLGQIASVTQPSEYINLFCIAL